tara:strand:- start:49 stop:504 length:456 start_codon:yes stop_codon:yes gene_type:complete
MCPFKNVLIPTDFGPAAWNAVQFASEMCENHPTRITLLHIYPSRSKFDFRRKNISKEDQASIKSIDKEMKSLCAELKSERNLNLDSVIMGGWVDIEILDYINKNNFDLVIMGVNSNGLDNRPGSHISKIIEKANAPVLVIPNKPVDHKVTA